MVYPSLSLRANACAISFCASRFKPQAAAIIAMKKAIKALLALKGVDAATHSGNLKQFNYHYVFHGDGTFTPDDYQIVAAAEQIRNLSDYDDFYIARKESAVKQVENARKLVEKIRHATESLLC